MLHRVETIYQRRDRFPELAEPQSRPLFQELPQELPQESFQEELLRDQLPPQEFSRPERQGGVV